MPRILLIGSSIFRKDFEDILSNEGFEVLDPDPSIT